MRMLGLIGVTLLGLALRLYRLGALGFAGNEDYLALSVRSILENWIPVFPSGVVYPRALPLTYVAAVSAGLLGFSEFSLRLPGVLFSTGTMLLLYYLGRRLFGHTTGLVAALLLAVSDWDVTTARTARMYSMLAFFVLLSLVLAYRASVDRRRWAAILAPLSVLAACLLHQLAFALVPMLACLALYLHRSGRSARLAVACLLLTVLGAAGNDRFEGSLYGQWNTLARERDGGFTPTENETAGEKSMRRVRERALPVFLGLRQAHPGLFLGLGAALTLALGACAVRFLRRPGARVHSAALAGVAASLWAQQAMLALCLAAAYFLAGRAREPSRYARRAVALLVVVGAGTILWVLYALSFPESIPGTPRGSGTAVVLETTLKSLFYYPRNFGTIFLDRTPWLCLLAAGSLIAATRRYLRDLQVDETGLVGLLLVIPALLLGSHLLAFSRFHERYVHFLVPFFLLLAARAVVLLLAGLRRRMRERGLGRAPQWGAAGILVLALGVVTQLGGATRSWALVTAGYGLNEVLSDQWPGMRPFYPDHEGPALFVKERYREGDRLVAMDILATSAYFPRVDYQLTLTSKGDAEGWFRSRTRSSASSLRDLLERSRDRNVWIILAEPEITRHAGDPQMEAILDLIHQRAGDPVYPGRDGRSDVYLVPAGRVSSQGTTP